MKLIITADDYGMSLGVNEGIEKGIEAGIITSTNVMTNMPYLDFIKTLKVKYPKLSIGLHWTVSCGKPVLNPAQIPSLVDHNGNFFPPSEFVRRLRRKQIKRTELRNELIAQYQKYVELCGVPDYWNTHQNTHVNLEVFYIFLNLAAELNIPKMRFHKKIWVESESDYKPGAKFQVMEHMKLVVLNKWKKEMQSNKILSPDGLITFKNPNENFDSGDFMGRIVKTNDEIGELVIHPATQIDSAYLGKMTDNRLKECALFSSVDMKQYLSNHCELVSYHDLSNE